MPERYPMCKDRQAQIDCRVEDCQFYSGSGRCSNVSPAVTVNPDHTCVCWSFQHKLRRDMYIHTVLRIHRIPKKPWPTQGAPADWIHEELVWYSQGSENELVYFIPLWKLLLWKLQGLFNPPGEE